MVVYAPVSTQKADQSGGCRPSWKGVYRYMTGLKWWMRIVGLFYLLIFVAAVFIKAPISTEGPVGVLALAATGDPMARFVVDTWVTLGLELGARHGPRRVSGECPAMPFTREDDLRLSIRMGLTKGLRLIRGMRRQLSEDERTRVAETIREQLMLSNWKIEKGPPIGAIASSPAARAVEVHGPPAAGGDEPSSMPRRLFRG